MKIYIQTDIEGVAGVTFFENRSDESLENQQHRHRMRRLLTGEVNAAVSAALEAGASDVLVNDSHGSGYNIFFEDLNPRCEIIHGRNCSGPHWMPELDSTFEALILVGMHAMADTAGALLQHSRWDVNDGDMLLSEASMAAAIAGDFEVPTVFVSGDDTLVREVKGKIPDIEAAVVKKSLSPYQARSLIPARACNVISEHVKKGINRRDSIMPFRIKGPVNLNLIKSRKGNHDQSDGYAPVLEKPLSGENITEAFNLFEQAMPWTSFGLERPDGFTYP